jgi:hypothetical protein
VPCLVEERELLEEKRETERAAELITDPLEDRVYNERLVCYDADELRERSQLAR